MLQLIQAKIICLLHTNELLLRHFLNYLQDTTVVPRTCGGLVGTGNKSFQEALVVFFCNTCGFSAIISKMYMTFTCSDEICFDHALKKLKMIDNCRQEFKIVCGHRKSIYVQHIFTTYFIKIKLIFVRSESTGIPKIKKCSRTKNTL